MCPRTRLSKRTIHWPIACWFKLRRWPSQTLWKVTSNQALSLSRRSLMTRMKLTGLSACLDSKHKVCLVKALQAMSTKGWQTTYRLKGRYQVALIQCRRNTHISKIKFAAVSSLVQVIKSVSSCIKEMINIVLQITAQRVFKMLVCKDPTIVK